MNQSNTLEDLVAAFNANKSQVTNDKGSQKKPAKNFTTIQTIGIILLVTLGVIGIVSIIRYQPEPDAQAVYDQQLVESKEREQQHLAEIETHTKKAEIEVKTQELLNLKKQVND